MPWLVPFRYPPEKVVSDVQSLPFNIGLLYPQRSFAKILFPVKIFHPLFPLHFKPHIDLPIIRGLFEKL